MSTGAGVVAAAQLFKVLGSDSRLGLLLVLGEAPRTVGALADATGLTQPLVSQHLRTLRQIGLVTAERRGKEVSYQLADLHVSHMIAVALAHVQEPSAAAAADKAPQPEQKESA